MLPIEVGEISLRRQNFIEAENNEVLQVNLVLIEQVQVWLNVLTQSWHLGNSRKEILFGEPEVKPIKTNQKVSWSLTRKDLSQFDIAYKMKLTS